jgi:hypothetical protein
MLGKRASIEDGLDQTSQSWGSSKSPKLEHEKPDEQTPEVPFRKARVSVRARSDAPLVSINLHLFKKNHNLNELIGSVNFLGLNI